MMAARFRSVKWVAVAVVPALACYLVTQHVAAERAQVAKVEHRIGQTRRAIRDLETELGTRGSMAQIERWNGETFALAAPAAEQFVSGDVQLASLNALPPVARPTVPAVVTPAGVMQAAASAAPAAASGDTPPAAPVATVRQAAFRPEPVVAPVRQTVMKSGKPASSVRQVAFKPEPAAASSVRQVASRPTRRAAPVEAEALAPLLRQATYEKPSRAAGITRVALLDNGPLDSGTLADIGRIASAERGRRHR